MAAGIEHGQYMKGTGTSVRIIVDARAAKASIARERRG
jgi:hypothetical protein